MEDHVHPTTRLPAQVRELDASMEPRRRTPPADRRPDGGGAAIEVAWRSRSQRRTESIARYVLDAPTLLHLVDNDLLVAPGHQLVAPNSIRSEALQLLLEEVRRGTRTERDAIAAHERITELKMRLLGDRVSRGTAWRLAREHDWETLRDAEYLAIARLQADALVTIDPKLAARAEGIVRLAPLEALLSSR